jgi:hypothetical protein
MSDYEAFCGDETTLKLALTPNPDGSISIKVNGSWDFFSAAQMRVFAHRLLHLVGDE